MNNKKNIFLSFSRKDRDFAVKVKGDLQKLGFYVWTYNQISSGSNWDNSIKEALENSDVVILIVSPDSVNSKDIKSEIAYAIDKGIHVLLLIYKKTMIPLHYQSIAYADLTSGYDIDKLYKIIKNIFDKDTIIIDEKLDKDKSFIKPKMIRILNSLSIDMVLIKKGEFIMGDQGEQKKVTIENDFYLGKYPVTIAEYMHFANDVKKHYPEWKEKELDHYKNMDLSDNAPIIGVSWHDALAYCKWLSEKTGDNYRLPTEKEWEYACRAGTTTKWSFGDDESKLKECAWYYENSDEKTHPVGEKKPNPWGLYDMHGNVWEWCKDWYDEAKISKGDRSYFCVTR